MTKITVFGAGYVGLVQAAVFAEAGYSVVCADIDSDKVARLSEGQLPIYEPDLDRIVQDTTSSKRLKFTDDMAYAVQHGDVQFIAVGTPPDGDGAADLRHVLAVAHTIAQYVEKRVIVVVKSTVPVGTCDQIREIIADSLAARGRSDTAFDIASNPEFLREGSAVADCTKPDRIIIGTNSRETEAVLRDLYGPFNRLSNDKFVVMDVRSAELAKYAANVMLASRITLMNEIAVLADCLGANIESIRVAVGKDSRIGPSYLYAGVGYGGSCFPKDIRALIRAAQGCDFLPTMLEAVEARNAAQKQLLSKKILRHFGGDLTGRRFALWGLAFKPNTNDMREAPSRETMEALWEAGATVAAFDPKAHEECRRIYGSRPDLILTRDQDEALDGADALVIVTEWKSFRAPDLEDIKRRLKSPLIFDGRNLYDPKLMSSSGFTYYSIGRPVAYPQFEKGATGISPEEKTVDAK